MLIRMKMLLFAKTIIFLVFCISLTFSDQQLFEDDDCVHIDSGLPGICMNIIKCPKALEEIKNRKLPQTCDFKGTVPIVCCAKENTEDDKENVFIAQRGGGKSRQKCIEYAQYVNETYISPVLSGGKPIERVRNNCGIIENTLIVGGTKAKGKEFPHMAAIGYDANDGSGRVYHCGGSLVSENFVLTAAHCLFSRDHGIPKYVRVGDLNLKQDDDEADPQEYDIAETIRHPQYKAPMQYHDIALLRLTENVRFSAFVRPICLTTKRHFGDQKPTATGWGKQGSFSSSSDHLLKVTLEFFTFDECRDSFQPSTRKLKDGIVDDSQVCAGSKSDLKDTCPGDSGGPLQVTNTDADIYCMYDLVGITSFGKLCGASHSPAVYTRVSNYVGWIESVIWP